MNLENYLAKSNGPFQEILSEFDYTSGLVEELCNRVREIGYNGYVSFVREHQEDILQYIGLSPSQRAKKKWVNHSDILLIRLAALQISGLTLRFLAGMRESLIVPQTNGSYREFHRCVAGKVLRVIENSPFVYFPFRGYDNPFFS